MHAERIDLAVHPVPKDYGQGRVQPQRSHYDTVVSGDTDAYEEDGSLAAVVRRLPWDDTTKGLLNGLRTLRYQKQQRIGSMMTNTRTFGFMPRRTLTRDCCASCALMKDAPALHVHLEDIGVWASEQLRDVNPTQYQRQREQLTAHVRPEWRMREPSLYTSGIINSNHALAYHRDGGNFKDSWNSMIVLQDDMMGGELVVPRWRAAFSFPEPTLVMMPAVTHLHGVLPLRPRSRRGYRYSVVWYSLSGMAKCESFDEELARVRRLKTERSQARTASPEEQRARAKGGGK